MTNDGIDDLVLADIRKKPIRAKVLPAIRSICNRYSSDVDEYDVFHSLASGESQLYINNDGFFVLRQDLSPFNRERILFVFIAFAFKKGRNFLSEDKYHNWLKELAVSINADKLQFYTQRKGYKKILNDGWKEAQTVYEWEINK